ncbi:glycine zipper domain-containing protein [Pectinatus frisingensis]|uniref:glycine zipper domain-containing protein n=1 Tax=Pectinatus frisingensis TaxID=865 RepID=UPI0015F6570C|nr:glycine zipper domain-containing protein [Pectinatus frisingensis]
MKLNKILSLTFSCLFVLGTLGISTTNASAFEGSSTAPTYSKTTTGAIAGGIAGALIGHNSKKGHTAHAIADAAIGAVVGGAIAHNT